jgi:viroplasmin and RNaseH domain-containing protein
MLITGETMGKGKIYVVFEGREPGIYHEWSDVFLQVNGWSNNFHESYNDINEAEEAYERYCKKVGREYVKTSINNSYDVGESSYTRDFTQIYSPQTSKFLYCTTYFS